MKLKSTNADGTPIWDWPSYREFLIEFKKLNCSISSEYDNLKNMPNRRTVENHYSKRWSQIKKDAGLKSPPNMLNDADLIDYIKTSFDIDGASVATLHANQITPQYLAKRFGSMAKVFELTGYNLKQRTSSDKSDADLLTEYVALSNQLGKPATVVDLNSSKLTESFGVYETRFGTMNHIRELVGMPVDSRNLKQHSQAELIEILRVAFAGNPDIKYADLRANLKLQHVSISTLQRYFGSVKKDDLYGLINNKLENIMEINVLDNKIKKYLDDFSSNFNKLESSTYISTLTDIGFIHYDYNVDNIVAVKAGKSKIPDTIPDKIGVYVFSTKNPEDAAHFSKKFNVFKESHEKISVPKTNDVDKSNIIYVGGATSLKNRLTAHLNFPGEETSTYALHLGKFKSFFNFPLTNITLDVFFFDDNISKNTQLTVKELTENYFHNVLKPHIGSAR